VKFVDSFGSETPIPRYVFSSSNYMIGYFYWFRSIVDLYLKNKTMSASASSIRDDVLSAKKTRLPSHVAGYERIRVVGKGSFGNAILYRRKDDDSLVILKEINMHEVCFQ
jgi:hypothetical protein